MKDNSKDESPKSSRRFIVGPAVLVTAAFIGPGTVITASTAGAKFGCSLLWAVVFACVTTIVLQEMAARLGIVSQAGLGQAISKMLKQPVFRVVLSVLVVAAILVGNAAYQTGNILGAATGVEILQSSVSTDPQLANEAQSKPPMMFRWLCVLVIGAFASAVVLIGRYKLLQQVLTVLVILMSCLFLFAAAMSQPSLAEIGRGLIPSVPETGAEWFVIGLIGTTVVPYNLFLHASLAAKEWSGDTKDPEALSKSIRQSRWDTILSVMLGGLVTSAILLTASTAFAEARNSDAGVSLSGIGDVARQLEPAIGSAAKWLFAIGLFAAGLTSAVTAPIAAGYATAGCFGWPNDLSDWRLKATSLFVILIGVVFGIMLGSSPKETIVLAQVANGILLPVLAILLLVAVNQARIMGLMINGKFQNILAVIVIGIVLLIAARQFKSVYEKVFPAVEVTSLDPVQTSVLTNRIAD